MKLVITRPIPKPTNCSPERQTASLQKRFPFHLEMSHHGGKPLTSYSPLKRFSAMFDSPAKSIASTYR